MKSLRTFKYYNRGGEILAHLPDCLFWFIWPLWRSLTESLALKSARKEFNDAIKFQVIIEKDIFLHPNQQLTEQLKEAKDRVSKTYDNLTEEVHRYSSQNG